MISILYPLTHQRCQPLKQVDWESIINEIGLSILQKNRNESLHERDHGSWQLIW